jgi:hypothetical protein
VPPIGRSLCIAASNDSLELWHIPDAWPGEDPTPVAYQSVPKDWIVALDGIEGFIAPAIDADAGLTAAEIVFGQGVIGERKPNPDNPRGYITIVTREDLACPNPQRTLMQWKVRQQAQIGPNRQIFEIGRRASGWTLRHRDSLRDSREMVSRASRLGLFQPETVARRPVTRWSKSRNLWKNDVGAALGATKDHTGPRRPEDHHLPHGPCRLPSTSQNR